MYFQVNYCLDSFSTVQSIEQQGPKKEYTVISWNNKPALGPFTMPMREEKSNM